MKKWCLIFAIAGCAPIFGEIHAQSYSPQQQAGISYGEYMEMCTKAFQVAVEAKALLKSGKSVEDVTESLVSKYAYGPNGEVLRNSADTETFINQIVAHMDAYIRHPENFSMEADYSSQNFLADCHNKALQHSQ